MWRGMRWWLAGWMIVLTILFPALTEAQTISEGAPVRWQVTEDGITRVWRWEESQEGGRWVPAASIPGRVKQIMPGDEGIWWALTDDSLFRSIDLAERWEKMDTPGIPTALALSRSGSGRAYLGTRYNGTYRSDNGGRTWIRLAAEPAWLPGTAVEVTAIDVSPQDEDVIAVAAGYWLGTTTMRFAPVGVFLSVDGGSTWLPLHTAAPGEARVEEIRFDATDPLTVEVATARGQMTYRFGDVALLDRWLTAPEPAQRAAAAKTWGWIGGERARERLLAALTEETDPAVGQAIAEALGPIADASLIPQLSAALADDDPQVRWRAATVLGYIDDPRAVEELRLTLLNDNSIAREAAARALARIGTPEAAAAVIPLLSEHDLSAERHLALATLEQMGDAAVEPLIAALQSERPALRRGAAEALGWIRSPRATAALAAALRDPSEAVRVEAAWALGQIGTDLARQALLEASQDPSPYVRTEIVRALGQIPEPAPSEPSWPALVTGTISGWWVWLRWVAVAVIALAFIGLLLGWYDHPRVSSRR
ncbi:MAG: hypothetical protein Kow0047_20550 [Anaerolineae bacterium]